jgi:hypothetical protein
MQLNAAQVIIKTQTQIKEKRVKSYLLARS